jgi:hypothetical protein
VRRRVSLAAHGVWQRVKFGGAWGLEVRGVRPCIDTGLGDEHVEGDAGRCCPAALKKTHSSASSIGEQWL